MNQEMGKLLSGEKHPLTRWFCCRCDGQKGEDCDPKRGFSHFNIVRSLPSYPQSVTVGCADMSASLEDLLCTASASGNRSEVTRLLQNGADVNGFNQFNRTALQVAKTSDTALILELLLAGANPNAADPACGLTVLHDASREGFDDSARLLLERGADANVADFQGNLPLHAAAREGHLKVVQLLIGQTANPQQGNKEGSTALSVARLHEKTDTVQYLMSISER